MGYETLLEPVAQETVSVDVGLESPVALRRIDDLAALIRVAQTQREARSLARHWTGVYGFAVSEEVVQAAAVIAACWDGPSIQEIVQMSRTRGPLLVALLKECNRLNGWEERGVPFGRAGGGTGS